jgi:hypothetical protein
VDIISMSWTFDQKNHQTRQETLDFRTMIQEASKGALLFASMNDAEPMVDAGDFYPVGLPDVFKIGSAKNWGANASFAQEGKSEYLFPGENVKLEGLGGNIMPFSGSSLATAFAAGMAGLIIYSMRVHLATNDSEVLEEVKERRLAEAKMKVGMTKIFNILGDNLATGTQKDVPVAFRKKFPQETTTLKAEKTRILREFLSRNTPD